MDHKTPNPESVNPGTRDPSKLNHTPEPAAHWPKPCHQAKLKTLNPITETQHINKDKPYILNRSLYNISLGPKCLNMRRSGLHPASLELKSLAHILDAEINLYRARESLLKEPCYTSLPSLYVL